MKKRPITSAKIFEELGYKWTNIISVPTKILALYEDGEPVSEVYTDEEFDIDDETASSTLDMIGTSTEESLTTTTDEELAAEVDAILNP